MSDMILCCGGGGGACQYVAFGHEDDCQGELLACYYAIQHEGWVECLE
jgi:hypothetical protein